MVELAEMGDLKYTGRRSTLEPSVGLSVIRRRWPTAGGMKVVR